jgi:hypothetical protein
MLISFVAGAVAIAALVRLTAIDFGADAGGKAALMLMASPLTVFLTAGYTEALFLGFALPAWLCARRRRWAHAAILAAGASCVRISGLFLAVALVVEFAAQWLPGRGLRLRPGRRELLAAPWLALPLLPIVGYFAYLRERTGSWTYWFEAQRIGWHRENTGFRATFDETIDRAYRGGTANVNMAWSFRMELVAVAVGVVLIVVLLARLRYAEATYVGLSLCALATSTVYFSVARAALLWWPLWAGLGALAAHPRFGRYVTRGYLAFAAPFAAIFVAAFTANRWVG